MAEYNLDTGSYWTPQVSFKNSGRSVDDLTIWKLEGIRYLKHTGFHTVYAA